MTKEEPDDEGPPDLEWRDYIAITLAALETVLLPLVIFVVILILAFLIIR